MKDEIKEIEDILKTIKECIEKKDDSLETLMIPLEQWKLLLDYITNLEEKYDYMYDKLTSESTEWESKYYNLQKENERYKKIFEGKERFFKIMPDDIDFIIMSKADYDRQVDDIELVAQELKSRNEKAIEYIKHEWFKREQIGISHLSFSYDELQKILNILQGSDNNE